MESIASLLDRLPVGWSEASYDGRRYGVTRSVRLGGRVQSVYAEELGGTDVISANLYLPSPDDEQFRPCEMPAAKVRAFLEGVRPTIGSCGRASAPRRGGRPRAAR